MNILGTTFAALLNNLWQSAGIALFVWAALRFLPRIHVKINAATRCAVWWAVLAAVMLLPMAPQPRTRFEAPPSSAFSTEILSQSEAISISVSAVPVTLKKIETRSRRSRVAWPLHLTPGSGLLAIFAIWSALSLFRVAKIIRSYRFLRGIKQRSRAVSQERMVNFNYWLLACGIDRTARLLVSSEIVSPMAVGFRRPAVIVPETLLNEFTPEELDHVLLHELAHIARYDDWTNLFARMIGALLPIHPVAVWLVKQIEQEREIACDDWVVAMTGEARPYAASLTRLFELCSARRRQLLATGMADRASHLGERIEALLRTGRDFAPRVSLMRVALGAAVLFGLVLAGARAPHWVAFAQEPVAAPLPPSPALPPPPPVPPVATAAPVPPIPTAAPKPPRAPQRPVAAQDLSLQNDIDARQEEVQRVNEQLERLRREIEEKARTYTPVHPDMVRLAEAIREQKAQLDAQKAQMAEMQSRLRVQILNAQRDAAVAQNQAQVQARQLPQTVPVARLEFVASIKPHQPSAQTNGPRRVGMSFSGMRANVEGMTAYGLIGFAYDLTINGLKGGPRWAETDSFDMEIKVEGDTALTRDQFRQVFKTLLAERFNLSVHQTTEDKNIYALVVAKNGPKLKESAPDARSIMRMTGNNYAEMTVSKWTMAQLARQLSAQTERPVLDKTGLAGSYDFKLAWTGESNENPAYPPLLTALQEQLGLKLESQKGPVEILVIDRIERPSEN